MARLEHFDESTRDKIVKLCKEYVNFWNDETSPETSFEYEIQQIDKTLRWLTPPLPIDPFNKKVGLQFNVDFKLVAVDRVYNMPDNVGTSFYVVVVLYLFALPEERLEADDEALLELINEINRAEPNVKLEYEESVDNPDAPSWVEVVCEVKTNDEGVVSEDELRDAINSTLDAPYAYYLHFELLNEI